jgi:hypothetical protein
LGGLITLAVILASSFLFAAEAFAATPNWNVTGNYVIAMSYLGSDYLHDVNLVQHNNATLAGNGGHPAGGPHTYTWVIDPGSVSGNTISFTGHYTASADAVTPLTTLNLVGTVSNTGAMSGTWSDNYQGGVRNGAWHTTVGTADPINDVALVAEDFGVVNYNTGLGILKGYTAGFGLTGGATFEDVQSVVVKLYAGDKLLQRNTATAKVGDDVTGDQISSPFDVSGTFDYDEDGYWNNFRKAQYGQSVPATKVVATVILEDGTVLTATNTRLTGDPTTIYPDVVVGPAPTKMSQCKKGGWKTFTNPTFKNQGQCVKYVTHLYKGNLKNWAKKAIHGKSWKNSKGRSHGRDD